MTHRNRVFIGLHLLVVTLTTVVIVLLMTAPPAHASTRPSPPHIVNSTHRVSGNLTVRFSDQKFNVLLYPCQHEDSTNCWWSAHIQGNGDGHSFAAVTRGDYRCLAYLNPHYAAKHDRCV